MQQTITVSRQIATHFQQLKGIFSNDPLATQEQGQADFIEYVEYLLNKGLKINNLQLARFKTGNNLPYLGLQATQNIEYGSTLVQVPRQLMLTTKIAYFSEIQEIFDAFPQFFCQHCSGGWQDQVLLTYILYQSQLGRESQWYHLIKNLPRDIDYLIFWSDEELNLLNDEILVKKAKKELKDFELVRDTLTKILDNYPQYFKKETYSHDNIKWIFIHLVSRCFGSSLEQVAFVPFCEMFNHENTDVCYQGEYLEGNPHAKQPNELVDESDESDGDSETYDEDDYQYPEQVQEAIKNYKNKKPGYKVIEEELTNYQNIVDFTNVEQVQKLRLFQEKCNNRIELQIQYVKCKRWFQENLNLRDNFTILFVSKCLEFIQEQVKLYDEDILTFDQVQGIINQFNENSEKYLENVKQYSLKNLKQKSYQLKQFDLPEPPQQTLTADEMLGVQIPDGVVPFQTKEEWQEDKFDNFIIKCSSKDHFDKGSQVYFSYGTLSNRSLLLRYGFTLQYNIYDYVTIKVQYIETIPYANDIADYFQLSKFMKFKLKYNRINDELLMYCKMQRWSYDQGIEYLFDNKYSVFIIEDAYKLINDFRLQYPEKLEDLTQELQNEKLGYHEYFALIYRIEKLRILESQLEALQILKCKIQNVEWSGQKFEWTKYLVDKYLK